MCGIFGIISASDSGLEQSAATNVLADLFRLSEMRGKESAGITVRSRTAGGLGVYKQSLPASKLIKTNGYKQFLSKYLAPNFDQGKAAKPFSVLAHARLVTNGTQDDNANNQPIAKLGAVGVHNGIICNIDEMWEAHANLDRQVEVDTEWLMGMIRHHLLAGQTFEQTYAKVYTEMTGTASTALHFEDSGQVVLATNCGSLYYIADTDGKTIIFCSEKMILIDLLQKGHLGAAFTPDRIVWLKAGEGVVVDTTDGDLIPFKAGVAHDVRFRTDEENTAIADESPAVAAGSPGLNLLPDDHYRKLFEFNIEEVRELKRCSKCTLPETFPFIEFDQAGVCSYCHSYEPLTFDGEAALEEELKKYRKGTGEPDCIVTLSGGRDSCFVLHKFVNDLGMKPIAYTYDWGMVTDLARRNQSRMCGALGVEHIVISADITMKRRNIRKNVKAWLKRPSLGTIPLFMAGDKQYFYYANLLQKRYETPLVVMGENMLETTNFKSGYAGIRPKFGTDHTFTLTGKDKAKLLWYYGKEYMLNPSYLNASMYDTMHAFFSYYMLEKNHLNLFDYLVWDEKEVEGVLFDQYNWELSPDTTTSWRIGDGTAAFYNYIYYNVAGFSEFDTFRSNQVREGVITREQALAYGEMENRVRYESVKWYCDVVGLDLERTIKTINAIPKHYRKAVKS